MLFLSVCFFFQAEDGIRDLVRSRGLGDVYKRQEVRSRDTDRIALWMIDADYNGDSFFVRHCYFTGGLSLIHI